MGWGIIAVAALSRLVTYPITKTQIKSAQKGKEFQTKYEKLKKKYAKNKEKLNEELAKLQARYLPGQLAGCLPIIILIVFLIQVRNVIRALVENGAEAFNEVAYPFISKFAEGTIINLHFLGIDLSKVATDFSWSDHAIVPYVALAVLVGLTQLVSTQILTGVKTFGAIKDKPGSKKEVKKGKKKGEEAPDMSEIMTMANKQMMFMFPVLTVITSLGYWGGAKIFPSGISLFWTIQSLFVIIQQLLMNRKKTVEWIRGKFGRGADSSKK